MIDLSRCYFNRVDELPVAASGQINVEGGALLSLLESGNEVVKLSDGVTNLAFSGVSIATTITPSITSHVENVAIPSSPGPYVVSLEKTNLNGTAGTATGEVHIVNSAGTVFTNLTGGSLALNGYQIVYSTGVVTFHSGNAGQQVVVTYRYLPTVQEAISQFYQGNVNNFAHTFFRRIGIMKAPMKVFTDQFVASRDWATVGPGTVKAIAGGLFDSSAGTGVTVATARVIHVPDADIPMLGLQFDVA